MGDIETRGRQRKKRRDLKRIILQTTAVAGVLAVAVVAPNVLTALHKLGFMPTPFDGSNIARARKHLVRKGLLAYEGAHLRLTKKGEAFMRTRMLSAPLAHQKWDGRWRILIFDIPEYRKGLREKIRRSLVAIGFERLQDSVWAYPYDCEDFITLLKADFKVGKDMLYMVVDELEYDMHLKQRFGLQRGR